MKIPGIPILVQISRRFSPQYFSLIRISDEFGTGVGKLSTYFNTSALPWLYIGTAFIRLSLVSKIKLEYYAFLQDLP